MAIKPLGKRILIKSIKQEEQKSASGIIIPTSAEREAVTRAIVLALGTDGEFKVSVGDNVIVGMYAGVEVKYNNEKLILVKENDVLAIVGEHEAESA